MSADQQINDALAARALEIILTGFEDFGEAFSTITQRAEQRFERRDWQGMRRDTVERLDLYPKIVDETVQVLLSSLGSDTRLTAMWERIKGQFAHWCQDRCDFDIACTFYNSIHRKVFAADGIDHRLIFAMN